MSEENPNEISMQGIYFTVTRYPNNSHLLFTITDEGYPEGFISIFDPTPADLRKLAYFLSLAADRLEGGAL